VPPALLAAIASRESRAGSALDSRGFGDHGNGFGLMQVDKRYHSPKGGPFSAGHIDQAAGILKSYLNQVKANHPSWPPEQQLRGAVAAYNSGVSNVRTIKNMDVGTTGNDYSNDVWARAQELAPHFGGKGGTTGTDGPSRPTAPSRPSGGADLPNVTLKEGSRGENVKTLQKSLEKLGFELGAQDGVFGPKTEQAVKRFQGKHNLDAGSGMGSVGPTTLAAMEKAARSDGGGGATPAMRKLAAAGRQAALSIGGYQSQGLCATGVSKAIQNAFGFKVWGNGNQIDNNLPRDKFKQVNMSLAEALKTPGLVLTWEKTSSRLGSIYGHTAITTGDGRSSVSDFIESNTLNAGGRSGLKIFRPTL